MTLIELFDVPPQEDDAFLAAWAETQRPDATLYRALRADVAFRFVAVAPDAGQYEVVREHGTLDIAGGAVLVEPFAVAERDDESFLAAWQRAREALAQQRGYLGTRLYRSRAPADFRFVDVARWSSPLMYARALERPELRSPPFRSLPALYQEVARPGRR